MSLREIVLDTETTGLKPEEGHRLVEIGCVELWNHVPTGKVYHQYINPERGMPQEAEAVHGLTAEYLEKFPTFQEVYKEFLAFVGDTPLVIHNAAFDMKFINVELVNAGAKALTENKIIDTLMIARRRYPGAPASLDALCKRFEIDNSHREKHGALLDSEILAEVYLELLGGRQQSFFQNQGPENAGVNADGEVVLPPRVHNFPKRTFTISPEDAAAHKAYIADKIKDPLWKLS